MKSASKPTVQRHQLHQCQCTVPQLKVNKVSTGVKDFLDSVASVESVETVASVETVVSVATVASVVLSESLWSSLQEVQLAGVVTFRL